MTTLAYTKYVMSEDLTMKGLRGAAKAGDGYAKIVLAKLESKEAAMTKTIEELQNDYGRHCGYKDFEELREQDEEALRVWYLKMI